MTRTMVSETLEKVGKRVRILGWVSTLRDHGKITFLDLRDRTGVIQCVGQGIQKLSVESVIEVKGLVVSRPEKMVNKDLPTGKIELQIENLKVLSYADEVPIPIASEGYDIDEKVRMKYRYLDLRRPRMSKNIHLRFQATRFLRNYLGDLNFVEIETPILTKTTPEGARDFLVPSRLQPGFFYALPQSPQQYKQLLMVSGFERYFQIARCFRDEDPRADRAYGEFTQLDLEMSFVTQEDILQITEEMITQLVKTIFPHKKISQSPWPRISQLEALEKYKTDKPDLRENKNSPDELAFVWVLDFPLFTKQSEDDFFHGSGVANFAPSHHMFTAPHPEDIELLDKDPSRVRGLQHDLVLNGFETGGGSIRIHSPEIQEKIFSLIGFTKEQKREFEHILTAFKYGVPPHGGVAIGLDRFLMAVMGEMSVREVIAFPASAGGQTAVMNAPSKAEPSQLRELGINIASEKK